MDGDRGPVEVELKARCGDLERVREALLERGAQVRSRRREADVYLDHPSRSLAVSDEAVRVRETGDRAWLTYKGPRLDEATKTREEIDVEVEDAARARALLEALDFEPAGRVRKRRETLLLDGITVTLDRVDGLGTFVELELVVEEDVEGARRRVLELADELDLGEGERKSYLELLLEQDATEEGGPAGAAD